MILGGRAGLASWVLLRGEQREKEERHQIISLATIHIFLCCFGASCGIAAYSLAAHWKISIGNLDIIFGFTLGAFWWPSYCGLRQNYVVVSLLLIRDRSGPPGRT